MVPDYFGEDAIRQSCFDNFAKYHHDTFGGEIELACIDENDQWHSLVYVDGQYMASEHST